MAYPYTYQPQYYLPYQPPAPDQLAQLRQNQMQQPMMQPTQMSVANQPQQQDNSGIIWIQGGEPVAKVYPVAPGNTVQLWDSENPVIYLKSADMSGMPSMRILDYTERTAAPKTASAAPQAPQEQYVTIEAFNALAARLAALENKPCKCAEKKKVKEEIENV